MPRIDCKILIVGAGLAGLTLAHRLLKSGEKNFRLVEARPQIGGRIHTHQGIDLGATWYHDHHAELSALVSELGLERFHQFNSGKNVLVYSSMSPAHYFESHADAASPYRIAGGSNALAMGLAESFSDQIDLDCRVKSIVRKGDLVQVETSQGILTVQKVVATLPPRIMDQIAFSPPLPPNLTAALQNTHTWMSNAIKVGLVYKEPFWRSRGLSGTIIGQVGPVIELYDHSNAEDNHFCLMGFVNEGLRNTPPNKRRERIIAYISQHLGEEAAAYETYVEKDWATEVYTAGENPTTTYLSPEYGNPLFEQSYWEGRLLFSGAETSSVHGGYMDGAVRSGQRSAQHLLANN